MEIRNGKKVLTNLVTNQAKGKGEGRVKLTENVSAVDAWVTSEQIAGPKTHINGRPPKSAPKGKSVGNCEDEETETPQNERLGTVDLGSFEVLSDRGDEVKVDEPTDETTEMMPPLPPDSWFKKTEMLCGKFRKSCNEDHQDEEAATSRGEWLQLPLHERHESCMWVLGRHFLASVRRVLARSHTRTRSSTRSCLDCWCWLDAAWRGV